MDQDAPSSLRTTPLHPLHVAAGARMVPFAGWDMPLQYAAGIVQEHLHTRIHAGLFDVSHMAQIDVRGDGAAAWLESLTTADLVGLADGRQTYALMPNVAGGLIDDLMIQRLGDCFHIVCNASRRTAVLAQLDAHPPAPGCTWTLRDDRALLALQGPDAQAVLQPHGDLIGMRFLDVRAFAQDVRVSRSGYTGEDGFEISLPAAAAPALATRLLEHPHVRWTGLGARDTLRLEAGMCLYGNDIDERTTPVAASLGWAVAPARRAGGGRAGGFPGAAAILGEFVTPPSRMRVGLLPEGRAPQRASSKVTDAEGRELGTVTSGNHSPSLGRPIAMASIERAAKAAGTALFIESRGQRVPAALTALPFVPHRYTR